MQMLDSSLANQGFSIEVGGWLSQWHVAMQWHQCRSLDHDRLPRWMAIDGDRGRAMRFIGKNFEKIYTKQDHQLKIVSPIVYEGLRKLGR